jgi:hypothetical protein
VLRATVVLRAACVHGAASHGVLRACVHGVLRATVVLLHVWVRSNAPSAVERTMAGSTL